MQQWVQTDIFSSEEKERDYDRKLCKTWKGAVRNSNGVFWINTNIFPAGERTKFYMELKLALDFPYVHGEADIRTPTYGKGCPLDGDNMIKFTVFDSADDVRHLLLKEINGMLNNDLNLTEKETAALYRLTDQVVEKAMRALTDA